MDHELADVCRAEHRCLLTLDLDFANPLVFVPGRYCGIAVLRLPSRPTADHLVEVVTTLSAGLKQGDVTGKLWIVQRGRIREHQDEEQPHRQADAAETRPPTQPS